MSFALADTLYVAVGCYALGTTLALLSLAQREIRLQRAALIAMVAGLAAHTVFIGTICTRTGHPPLTNLPETATFISWTILIIALVLQARYRVSAASFFVYPLVLVLLVLAAIIGEPFARLDPSLRAALFTTHIFLTTVGIAGLMIGLSFSLLAYVQNRSLKKKARGRLWEWIPSLTVCKVVSGWTLSVAFVIYTAGLIAGLLWSYRTTTGGFDFHVKQIGAIVAWLLFAALIQAYVSGGYRARRTIFLSAGAFVAIVISLLGIARG